jgi:molybdate transport system substrate-binding protein
MSANMFYPTKLYQNKLAITKPKVYAKGMLALFSTKKRDFSKGMDILLQNDIHTIAIANPKTAPYGKAAKEVLKNLSIYKKIKHKLIYGESISQTVAYAINAADIAIISKSALFSPKLSRFEQGVNWICIDSKLYHPINQGIVLLKNAKNNNDAKLFYDFILHNKNAKKILEKYGYEIF